jgi:hypothetical protein
MMIIPEGTIFCCLALKGPRLRIKQEQSVLPGLTVSPSQEAFELEQHWVEWLGTIQAKSFRESSLFITAFLDSHPHTEEPPTHQSLDDRVRLFHHALVLLGCGHNNEVLMVGGEKHRGGSLHIGPVRPGLTPCFRPYYRNWRTIEASDLERAAVILGNLELIYSHAPGRLHRRLRKGFNVWIRGAQEGEEWIERLHSFVRSTEAVLKPTISRRRRSKTSKKRWREVTPTFIKRGQTVIGHSAKSERLLRQLYDIRSSVEHIKDVVPAIKKARGIASEEAFGFRALQSEILASTVYSRILTSHDLLNAFLTETSVEAFWSRIGHDRRALWGDPIDIDAESRHQFLSHKVPDFY